MYKYSVKLDRGSRYTKNLYPCAVCSKEVPSTKNMWEVKVFESLQDMIENNYRDVDFFCSKECANLRILKEC